MKDIIFPDSYKYIGTFLTMRCPLICSYCLNTFEDGFKRNEFPEISGDQWLEGLNRIRSRKGVPVTFGGGEPFVHKDFLKIINGLRSDLEIDILTNLQWGKAGIDRFIAEIDPLRINRGEKFTSIRVSYHPEQMGDGEQLVKDVRRMQDAGFRIGIGAVLYPGQQQLSAISQMQHRTRSAGVEFMVKEFTGEFRGEIYGNYSKYPEAAFSQERQPCDCRTTELLLAPNGDVHRCHKELYSRENPVGNITDPNFVLQDVYHPCNDYGACHPCDVKVKTDHTLGNMKHTSVDIKNVRKK